jgi:hypothetical protein
MNIDIQPLPLTKGMIARTLVCVDGLKYEVYTCNTRQSVGEETAEFWEDVLKEYPYETAIYKAIPASVPLTEKELEFRDIVSINDTLRRNLDLGDLYVSRSTTEDAAAMEHQTVIEGFKSGDVMLLTASEREAIYGPDKLMQ